MTSRPNITLRPAQPADDPFLRAVYADTRSQELAPVPWTGTQKRSFLDQQFDAQSAHYALHHREATHDVVSVDGRPCGRLIVLRTRAEVRIVDIALLTEFRGRGIGTALLAPILAAADEDGMVVSIHVEHLNPAMTLYRRLGFAPAGDAGVHVLMERRPRLEPAAARDTEVPAHR